MLTIFGLVCFLLAVVWLAYVLVVLRPRAQAWRNYAALRKYRRQPLPPVRGKWGRK